jgi:HD-GYP domain-containing protein (c-di-GMP phosphodiesterase class II)
MLTSPDDLAGAVARDPRMADYRVCHRGDGWIELEVVAQHAQVPVLLVLAWPEVWKDPARLGPHLGPARSGSHGLILVGTDPEFEAAQLEAMPADIDLTTVVSPIGMTRLHLILRGRADAIVQRMALERSRHENEMMKEIGRALSKQRDIKTLLGIILRRAREVTNADAGSIYIVEGNEDEQKRKLRFEVSQNDSRRLPDASPVIAVSETSIVGRCAARGKSINIQDLYALGNNPDGFVHDRSFDDQNRYQTRSVLAVPMISAREEVIGVIQLINKRARGWNRLDLPSDFEHGVVPFDDSSGTDDISALASQAGIALENGLLYGEVKTLFDGFVKAAVTAIESRDPTTSGHSARVAELTVSLASAVDKTDDGRLRGYRFPDDKLTQIRYAGLLHDFGKVGVREHVLIKAKKLYEHERTLILQRFQLIKRGYKIEGLESKVRYLMEASRDQAAERIATIDQDLAARIAELDDIVRFILASNEPAVLDEGGFDRIAEIAGMSWKDDDGQVAPFLSPSEASCLQIRRGSLTEQERIEINSHVVHSYNFLRQIPWSRALRDVPAIAGAHHEKLDGTGYPDARRGDNIPIEAQMMAITDIYDALTASDRPYKRAIPVDRALDILASDVKRGQLHAALFDVFVAARLWMLPVRIP